MTRDHNLLFGVFAVQLGKVSANQLIETAAAWAVELERGLPERLVEANAITDADRRLLQRLVDEAIAAHGGDVGQTLATFGGEEQVHRTYRGSIVLTADGQVSIPPAAQTPTQGRIDGSDPDGAGGVKGVFETPGRYTEIQEYGRGGMGRVLLVHDDFLGRDIALKELLPHLGEAEHQSTLDVDAGNETAAAMPPSPVRFSAHILARFLQEARITGQLEHPGIVPVYELGHRRDGSLYYTMKLVRGRSLAKALKECKNVEERLRLLPHFVDLCQAIAYAHSRGIIHRDIKPANVMVGEFGETVVLDWGLAKKRDREDVHEQELTETLHAMKLGDEVKAAKTAYGQIVGTPVYMSPEQAKGALEEVDEQSDVYALGVVLYEILTGDVPFEGKSTREVLEKVIAGTPIPVETREKVVPPELSTISAKAMEREKGTRYRDVKALAQEIERFQAGTIVQAHHYNIGDYTRLLWKRHSTPISMGATALLLLSLLSAYYVNQLTQANQALTVARDNALAAETKESEARLIAEKRLYLSKISEANTHIENGRFDLAQPILLEAPIRFRNWEWGYLLARCNQDRFTIDGGVACAAYRPDGSEIAAGFDDGTVALFDAVDGEMKKNFQQHSGRVLDLAFSPDGSYLVTASEDGLSFVWPTLDSTKPLTLAGHEGSVTSCAVSPDGQRVVTSDTAGRARLWDLHSGALLAELVGHEDTIHHSEFSPDGGWVLTAGMDWTARIWDSNSGEQVGIIQLQNPHVNAAFDPNGRFVLATSPGDPKTTLHKAPDGESLFAFPDSIDSVHAGRFGIQSDHIILQYDTVSTWSTVTGKKLRDIHYYQAQLSYANWPSNLGWLSYSRDRESLLGVVGNRLFVTALDYSGTPRKYSGHSGTILQVIESPAGNALLTQSADGTAKLWDPDAEDRAYVVSDGMPYIPASGRLTVDQGGYLLGVYDSLTDQEHLRIERMSAVIEMAAVSPDGTYLACVFDDNFAQIWEVETGNEMGALPVSSASVTAAIFSPVEDMVAIGYEDGGISMLNVQSMSEVWSTSNHAAAISSIQFSTSGEKIVTAGASGVANVWNAGDGALLRTVRHEGARMNGAGFNPDDSLLWTASDDGVVHLWERSTGNRVLTVQASDPAQSAALSIDNSRLVVNASQTLLYDLETETRILSIPGRNASIFSKDGQSLYAGRGRWLQAIPWENLGSSAGSLAQSIRTWKQERAAKAMKTKASMSPRKKRIVLRYFPRHQLPAVLESVRAFLSRLTATGQLAVDEGRKALELPDPMRGFVVEPDDRIARINGRAWDSITNPGQWMESEISEASDAVAIEVQSASGLRTKLILHADKATMVPERTIQLPYDAVVQILSGVAALLKEDYEAAKKRGSDGDLSNGYSIASDLPFLDEVGLKRGDQITAVDGAPITTLPKYIELIERALERIQKTKNGAISVELYRRGVGKMHIRWEVIPP